MCAGRPNSLAGGSGVRVQPGVWRVIRHDVKWTVSPARVGAQQNGPAVTGAAASRGATRTSRQGSSSTRARTVSALPDQLPRTVTSRPAQFGTGDRDQSDWPRVTTAPRSSSPSLSSTPALIHVSVLTFTKMPAWSNWSVKSRRNCTSRADSGCSLVSSACSVEWMKPYDVRRQASLPLRAVTWRPSASVVTSAGSFVQVPSVQGTVWAMVAFLGAAGSVW